MKITVCVKQVPDTVDIKWTEHNTLCRDGVESILNPCDAFAVETALLLKDNDENTVVTAISMGPIQAENVLQDVIAMGVDNAFLISDKAFAGSDTASTARVLSAAIKSKLSDTDLILCGQYASDGDTAQTGPSIAQNLNVALVSNVKGIEKVEKNTLIVTKQTDDGEEKIQVFLPAVLCIEKGDYDVRLPKIAGRIKAMDMEIPVYSAMDIDIDTSKTGIKGSPTYVKKAFRPENRKNCVIFQDKTLEESSDIIISLINEIKKDKNE